MGERLRRRTREAVVGVVGPAAVATLVTVAASLSGLGPAPLGRAAPAGAGEPALRLVSQDPWIIGRGTFDLRVAVVAPPGGGTVEVTLHAPASDPDAIVSGAEPDSPPLRRARSIDVTTSGEVDVPLEVVPEADGTPGDPLVLGNGVHPLRVELVDRSGRVVEQFVTHLVQSSSDVTPAPVALVVGVRGPPDRAENGRARISADDVAALAAPLDALAAMPDVPHTLDVRPETVSALTEAGSTGAAALLARLAALGGAPSSALSGPFVSLDASSWVAAGLGGMVGAELDTGFTTLSSVGLSPRAATTSLGERPSPALLALLASRNVDRVVVPAPDGEALGRGTITVAGSPVEAVEVGRAPPASPGQGVDVAHRLLAALAIPAVTEAPERRGRAVEVAGTTAADLEVMTTLLTALGAEEGPLRAVTVDALAEESPADGVPPTTVTTLRAEGVPPLDRATARIPATMAQLASLGTVIDRPDAIADLGGSLLVAASNEITVGARDALVGRVTRATDAVVVAVVVPERDAIAVTAHEANIPLLIRNDGPETLKVSLRLSSSELELTGSNPLQLTLEPGATDVEVPVRSRRSGGFDLVATLTSPDGAITLGETRWTVTSRAIPGGGLVLSIGAAAFLLLWWLRNARRARRRRGAGSPAAAAPPPPVASVGATVEAGP